MDLLENAKEELKRADHLIYVSLKYTRTRDILMNAIKRMIEASDFIILALLEKLKNNKKIQNIPESRINRAELLFEKEKKYKTYINLYNLFRKIEVSKIDGREEYRKHVTMIVYLEKKTLEIDVPVLEEYFNAIKEFVNMAEIDLE